MRLRKRKKEPVSYSDLLKKEHGVLMQINDNYEKQKAAVVTRMFHLIELGGMSHDEANDAIGEVFFARAK